MRVDVYPVGVLSDLRMAWRCLTGQSRLSGAKWRWRTFRTYARRAVRPPWRHIRNRRWRELKNDFNGYLAEPTPWPDGVTRCGSGWTRKRALRSLRRQVRRPGVRWEQVDREIVKAMGGQP